MIPKALRDRLGLAPGEVELTADGAALRIEAVPYGELAERGDRLVIPAGGAAIDDDVVQALRDADQR